MRTNYILLFFVLFTIATSAQEQKKDSVKGRLSGSFESNGQWYLNDKKRDIQHDSVPLRSNNYLSVNYNYGKWTTGVQVESYASQALLNYNPKFKNTNLGTYFLNYKSTKIDATLGHFYEQFGSGLLLRSYEDRSLGINNAIRGGRINFKPNQNLSFTALYGRKRTGFDVSKGQIFGFDSNFNLSSLLKKDSFELTLGMSYVGRYEKSYFETPNFSELTSAYSGRIGFTKDKFYINGEYNLKSKDAVLIVASNKVSNDFIKPGSAVLLNFGYSKKGLGFDTTLRRLENMTFLSEREPTFLGIEKTSLYYNDGLMNFLPSLTKQNHANLSNIYVYQAQGGINIDPTNGIAKAGEIGGQIDFFYDFKKGSALGGKYGTKVAINCSNWYNLGGKYTFEDQYGNYAPNYTTDFFATKEKYYSDYNIEFSKKLSSKVNGTLSYINQYYNNRYITGAANLVVKTNIVTAESTVKFSKSKSFTFGLEHMWADNDRKNWLSSSIEYNHNANWSMYVTDMYNYGYDANAELISHGVDAFRIHFYNFGGSYKKGSTRVALNYGRQRGGLVCAGGVCRYVPQSTGISLSLSTAF